MYQGERGEGGEESKSDVERKNIFISTMTSAIYNLLFIPI